jgi:hypothetical protein
MPVVRVADVVVVYRDVEIPTECPHCSAPLLWADDRLQPTLRRYSYALSYTHGQLAATGDSALPDRDVEDGFAVPVDDHVFELPSGGADGDLTGAVYMCLECMEDLAVGELHIVEKALPLKKFFGRMIEQQGWTERTTLHLAARFIEESGLSELFRKFLENVIQQTR